MIRIFLFSILICLVGAQLSLADDSEFQFTPLASPLEVDVMLMGYSAAQRGGRAISGYGNQLKATHRYHSVAADWSFLPMGTVFRLPGWEERNFVVDDYSATVAGVGAVELYFDDATAAAKFGEFGETISIIRVGDYRASYEKLRQHAKSGDHSYTMAQRIYARFERLAMLSGAASTAEPASAEEVAAELAKLRNMRSILNSQLITATTAAVRLQDLPDWETGSVAASNALFPSYQN